MGDGTDFRKVIPFFFSKLGQSGCRIPNSAHVSSFCEKETHFWFGMIVETRVHVYTTDGQIDRETARGGHVDSTTIYYL